MAEQSPRNGLTVDSVLSFPLLFHLNKQGGWPDRAQKGRGGGRVEEGREGWRWWGGLPWLEYNQREQGVGWDEQTTWCWKACRLLFWERQTETSPHIDAAVSPQQQFWEMAAVCTVQLLFTREWFSPLVAFVISWSGCSDPLASLLAAPCSHYYYFHLLCPRSQGFIAQWMKVKQWGLPGHSGVRGLGGRVELFQTHTAQAIGLLSTRLSGLLLVAPVFSSRAVPMRVRTGLL